MIEKPFLQSISEDGLVTVTANSEHQARGFAENYFSLYRLEYKYSDFNGNHTYQITKK